MGDWPKLVIEHRAHRFTHAIQELHLHAPRPIAAPLDPERLLSVHQKTVSIHGDSQPPASVSFAQVLQRCVPNQPIEKKGLTAAQVRRADHGKPGGVRCWLRSFKTLKLIKTPLQTGSRGFHRFAPGHGRISGETVASRCERWELDAQASALGFAESQRRLVIDLQRHMGSQAELGILGQGPVAHLQHQGLLVRLEHRAIGGAGELQLRMMSSQGCLKLLNRPWRRHFLQASAWGSGSQGIHG